MAAMTPLLSTPAATSTPTTCRVEPKPAAEDYVDKFNWVQQQTRQARYAESWAICNFGALVFFLYDIFENCAGRPKWVQCAEMGVLLVLSLNIVYHMSIYFHIYFTFKPPQLTPEQKQLLCIHPDDPLFSTAVEEPKAKKPDVSASAADASAASWLSLSLLSKKSTPASANVSWAASVNSSLSSSWLLSPGGEDCATPLHCDPDEPVVDEPSLIRYMDKLERLEQQHSAKNTNSPLNSSPPNLSLLWNSQVNSVSPDLVLPANMAYHLSSSTPAPTLNTGGSPGIDSLPGVDMQAVTDKFWQKEGFGQQHLSQCNKNLRQWVTATVLLPVLREVEATNKALTTLGAGEERVGHAPLDKLKRVSQTQQVAAYVPNLATLLPFLEISPHQPYLLHRLKELAHGGCMSDFRWNAGSTFNGKPWDDTLPTDTQIVLHLLAVYLDLQLPPMRHRTDPRPFSAVYLSRAADKPKPGANDVLIHQLTAAPPHFVLIWKGTIFELPKGRNNLLHTLLLFLHKLKAEEGGMLGRVSLGPSGLNILWVLDDA
ncbi:Hypothetical predicted protein [Cloeon dipterum]|uniref:Transmembrane protein 209 n=1 Tax=Cloeon dipterum TaxID=197152 RepID=A0A8S1BVG6_9INSE|nr:Hypothetical predicted protein [Cloeon dipterum]